MTSHPCQYARERLEYSLRAQIHLSARTCLSNILVPSLSGIRKHIANNIDLTLLG